ncbi:hypothetical protein J2S47_000201 [Streptomyces griseoviridis]|uniref:Uncharacterized protein n=1 Tax=Streptomyces griseoviridis TaxID=45398 RepID=A0ABT9L7S5_STRGD|nr:hypothetical protein [Streptomyces griseoviridis]
MNEDSGAMRRVRGAAATARRSTRPDSARYRTSR